MPWEWLSVLFWDEHQVSVHLFKTCKAGRSNTELEIIGHCKKKVYKTIFSVFLNNSLKFIWKPQEIDSER